ncbi:hypothetical protein [Massilia sp. Root351]|uniref:hypothetical protein n=1 Tax=Massilia sp. Root351 TaxID=1736522 RepID=UPI0012F64363|nr:hypothetical protein [Massilia sp. Root351]
MKKLILAALLGAVSMGAGWLPASAQTAQQEETVTIPAPQLRIDAPTRRHYMDEADFGAFKGGYELSNGQVLVLKRVGTRMYAEVGEMGLHQIVAVSPNTFVALDQKLKVRIDIDRRGDVGGELLMVVPGSSVAGGAPEQLLRVAFR